MAEAVYILRFLTSAIVAFLLLRAYRRNTARILLWSGLCFVGFALNNLLLFVDLVVLPQVDLSLIRTVPAVIGVALLVFGLIWDVE